MELTDVLLLMILLMLTMGIGCIATNTYSKLVETKKVTAVIQKLADVSVSLLTSMSQTRPDTNTRDPLAEFLARGVPPMPDFPAFNAPTFNAQPTGDSNGVPMSNTEDNIESID